MPHRALVDSLDKASQVVNSLLNESVEDMGLSPEIIKHLEDIESTIAQVELTIRDLRSIPDPVRDGLESTLKKINHSISLIKLQYQSPLDNEGKIERSGIGQLPDIHLEEFSLYPSTKEISLGKKRVRLPPAEFKVAYSLAVRSGQTVNLGSSHSLLTRLSNLRRMVPELKSRIESLGGGSYVHN
jgi:hypothetical protein